MDNLDLKCAELGSALAHDNVAEKTLTDGLSVLEEQGIYAFFLFLKARADDNGRKVSSKCYQFLQSVGLLEAGDLLAALHKLAEDLDKVLYARDLLRQSLVYGRYHAKSSNGGKA